MLRIYNSVLETLEQLRPYIARIQRCDSDLARQLRRASSSIALNVAEAQYSRGGNGPARFSTALGSARETLACLEVAQAMGYVQHVPPELFNQLDRIVATLWKLSRR